MGSESDTIYDIEVERLDGARAPLREHEGKVLLVVNTASHCGFTPQYAGLEALQREYADQGLVVLGFPCNQFGEQEPGDASQIGAFCQKNYGVSFPMHAKVDVKGPAAHPLFVALTRAKKGMLGSKRIKWNFTKFLVDRSGRVVARYGPRTPPEKLAPRIEELLRQS